MLQKYLISIDARLHSRNGTDSVGSLQWRSSGSDSLPLCLGHFLTSHIENISMKYCPTFSKTVWCKKIKKTKYFCVCYNPSSFDLVVFPTHVDHHIVKKKHLNPRMDPYSHLYRLFKHFVFFRYFYF